MRFVLFKQIVGHIAVNARKRSDHGLLDSIDRNAEMLGDLAIARASETIGQINVPVPSPQAKDRPLDRLLQG